MADDILSRYLGITDPNQQSAVRQGLLRAGLGMLANSSQPYGVSPLRGIGIGGLEGVQGYQDALAVQERRALLDFQRAMQLIKQRQATREEDAAGQLRRALESGDRKQISGALSQLDPVAAGKLALTPPKGQIDQTLFDALNNPQSPFYEAARSKYLGVKSPEAQAQALQRAISGRAVNNISLSTEKTYGEQLAGGLAKEDLNLYQSAQAAPDLATRANRVRQVLGSGNVITGTGAEFRLGLAKAAKLAGVGDNDELIANTETLAADLASNTLDAIKASGLGGGTGFSNADREFLERAKGGKIDMDAGALSRIAALAHKAAEKTTTKWQQRAARIPATAVQGTGLDTSPVQVPPLTDVPPAAAQPAAGGLTPAEQQELEELRKRFRR